MQKREQFVERLMTWPGQVESNLRIRLRNKCVARRVAEGDVVQLKMEGRMDGIVTRCSFCLRWEFVPFTLEERQKRMVINELHIPSSLSSSGEKKRNR